MTCERYLCDTLLLQKLDNAEKCLSLTLTILDCADHLPRPRWFTLWSLMVEFKREVEGLRKDLGLPLGEKI